MNINKMKQSWYPICRSVDLKKKPKAAMLFGEPIVLVRLKNNDANDSANANVNDNDNVDNGNNINSGGVSCFRDICPHRLAPLSKGKVINGRIQCVYHGWTFDQAGELQSIPGLPTALDEPIENYKDHQNNLCPKLKAQLHSYPCQEQQGWIWVRFAQEGEDFIVPKMSSEQQGFDRLIAYRSFDGDLIQVIENFLDPIHTAFLHRGLVRGAGYEQTEYHQSHDKNGFTTHYKIAKKQSGLISYFDSGLNIHIARFDRPSFAHITFYRDTEILYQVSWFFVPIDEGKVGMATNFYIPKTKVPSLIKFNMLRPIIECVFLQDKKMFAAQLKAVLREKSRLISSIKSKQPANEKETSNLQNQGILYHMTPADLVIDHLLHYLADAPEGIDKSGNMVLDIE